MANKDNFSENSSSYAKYRPAYPEELFQFLNSISQGHHAAWDCATGNGQVANSLTPFFEKIEATDMSKQQLLQAIAHPKITYKAELAETTNFANNQFDLITVAQALHWFDTDLFYKEADRVLKPGGILAVFGYPIPIVDKVFEQFFHHFYNNIIGPYWDPERHHIDEHYRNISFPYTQIDHPCFSSNYQWSFEHFMGFLSTWSGVSNYIKNTGENPLVIYRAPLEIAWGSDEIKKIEFPLFCKIGRKPIL